MSRLTTKEYIDYYDKKVNLEKIRKKNEEILGYYLRDDVESISIDMHAMGINQPSVTIVSKHLHYNDFESVNAYYQALETRETFCLLDRVSLFNGHRY